MKLKQYALIVIFSLLIGAMVWSAMAQEDVSLANGNNTELLERIASLETNVQAQAQEVSNLRNQKSNKVAIYAAMVATAAIIWNIYLGLRDRSKLKIEWVMERQQKQNEAKSRFDAVRFYSAGRRPIHLTYWGIRTTKDINSFGINGKTLIDPKPVGVYVVKFGLKLPEGVEDIFEIKEFFVHGSSGDEWGFSWNERRQLVKQLRKEISDDG